VPTTLTVVISGFVGTQHCARCDRWNNTHTVTLDQIGETCVWIRNYLEPEPHQIVVAIGNGTITVNLHFSESTGDEFGWCQCPNEVFYERAIPFGPFDCESLDETISGSPEGFECFDDDNEGDPWDPPPPGFRCDSATAPPIDNPFVCLCEGTSVRVFS
jgi:hypothetical protein